MDPPAGTESYSLPSAPTRESEASTDSSTKKTRVSVSSVPSQIALLRERRARSSRIEPVEKIPIVSVDPPVPTTRVLQNFQKVISRRTDQEAAKRKRDRLDRYKAANQPQRQILNRLRKWADAAIRPN